MKIETLQDLKKVIKLCRETGVNTITVDGIVIELGLEPTKETKSVRASSINTFAPGGITEDVKIVTEELTDEQRLFWSSETEQDTQQLL